MPIYGVPGLVHGVSLIDCVRVWKCEGVNFIKLQM